MTKIQIKKLSSSVSFPKYKTSGSSGMDIAAHIKNNIIINPGEKALIATGFSIAIPKGYEVQIRPRSGLAIKKNITVSILTERFPRCAHEWDLREQLRKLLLMVGPEGIIKCITMALIKSHSRRKLGFVIIIGHDVYR